MLNLIAPLGQTGYGVVGRNITYSLCEKDLNFSLFLIGNSAFPDTPEQELLIKRAIEKGQTFDYDAPCIKIWHQHDLNQFVGRGTHIGFPIFELDKFTEHEIHNLRYPDRLFVCSEWAREVIKDEVKHKDVKVVPLGIDPNIFYPQNNESRQQNDDYPYTFINIGKWEVRKGHDVIVELFNSAFSKQDNVQLLLMPHNPFLSEEEHQEWVNLYKSSDLGDKINILPPLKTHTDVANVISRADCGLFPSRAEGWNLELLEVMSMGKPVITTDYSAHTEFCNKNNSHLIDINKTEEAYDGKWFFGQGNWAALGENQLDQCIEYMRELYNSRPKNPEGVKTGQDFIWENSADKIITNIR